MISAAGFGHSSSNYAAGGNWPTSNNVVVYGGPMDMWGLTTADLNPTNVNDSSFGPSLQASTSAFNAAFVDWMELEVFYAAAPNATGPGYINFETGNLAEAIATTGAVSISTSHPNSGTYSLELNPSGAGLASYQIGHFGANPGSGRTYQLGPLTFPASTQTFIRFHVYVGTPPSATEEIFSVLAGGSSSSADLALRLTAAGALQLVAGGSVVGTCGTSLSVSNSYLIGLSFQTQTSGNYAVFINGVSQLVNTHTFGSAAISAVYLGKNTNLNSGSCTLYADDVAWSTTAMPIDTTGTILVPTGDSTPFAWTGNYTNVNTVPPSSASPLTSGSGGSSLVAAFTLTSSAGAGIPAGAQIQSVKVIAFANQPSTLGLFSTGMSGAFIGGTGYNSVDLTSSYAPYGGYFFDKPSSTNPWETTDLDIATAYVNNEQGVSTACEALYVLVDWSPSTFAWAPRPKIVYGQDARFFDENNL
jgi:hypothetical protein